MMENKELEKRKEKYKKIAYKRNLLRVKEYKKEMKIIAMEIGNCYNCFGEKIDKNKELCIKCRVDNLKRKEEAKRKGNCSICHGLKRDKNKLTCKKCRDYQNQWRIKNKLKGGNNEK